MELNQLIGLAIQEIKKSRENYEEKRNYLVEEITVELSLKSTTDKNGKLKFEIFNVGAEGSVKVENENAHKITIKLAPKNIVNRQSNQQNHNLKTS